MSLAEDLLMMCSLKGGVLLKQNCLWTPHIDTAVTAKGWML